MKDYKTRLVLGTAQLGMPYGIANKTGLPDQNIIEKIVETAWAGGIREFDTAPVYGDSEENIGRVFKRLGIENKAKVISKLSLEGYLEDPNIIRKRVEKTLSHLSIKNLYGVLLHRESDFDSLGNGLKGQLQRLQEDGLVESIGISVYSTVTAKMALESQLITIVQIPSNILDRRFENAGIFEAAKAFNKQIYIRSVFLQGLLLMEPSEISASMVFTVPIIERFKKLAAHYGISREQLALDYIRAAFPDAKIIFGTETLEQVKRNLHLWNQDPLTDIVDTCRRTFCDVDEKVLNPSLWPTH